MVREEKYLTLLHIHRLSNSELGSTGSHRSFRLTIRDIRSQSTLWHCLINVSVKVTLHLPEPTVTESKCHLTLNSAYHSPFLCFLSSSKLSSSSSVSVDFSSDSWGMHMGALYRASRRDWSNSLASNDSIWMFMSFVLKRSRSFSFSRSSLSSAFTAWNYRTIRVRTYLDLSPTVD